MSGGIFRAPFLPLRKQIGSRVDEFDMGDFTKSNRFSVRRNVSKTDKEICITAELPGIGEKDVDVSVTGDRITITVKRNPRGTKRANKRAVSFTGLNAVPVLLKG